MKCLLFLLLLCVCPFLSAQTFETENSLEIIEETDPYVLFWDKLYARGGWSLYCGFRFNNKGQSTGHGQILIEHIYPYEWILQSLSCDNRIQCHSKLATAFSKIETDLHNMYPVWWEVHSTKLDASYAEIDGEDWRFNQCDYERQNNYVEPREIARGNIARSIFYMHHQYNLPIQYNLLTILKKWNLDDLPSEQELVRNDLIEQIQGNRNIYIDNPQLANTLQAVTRND